MTPTATLVTREDLYRQVWATPLRKVAQGYGISDVALAKVCRKLNVPVPGRGHWAKVAAGKVPKARALPETARERTATIRRHAGRPARRPEETLPQPETVQRIGTVEVPATIERSHPLTAKTRTHFRDLQRRVARHAKRRPDAPYIPGDWPPTADHGRYWCAGGDGYHLAVSFAALERALGILDTLTKALATQGFKFLVAEPEQRGHYRRGMTGLIATKDDEQLHYFLREGYNRRERTAKELAEAKKASEYLARYENLPNGSFTLELTGTEYGVNETFRDSKSAKLETQLGRVIAFLVDAVPRLKELRAAREAEERASQERERRRWEEQERIRREKEQVEALLKEAARAREFELLREYLDRIERLALRNGGVREDGSKWLAEARRLVELYDPTQARLGQRSPSEDDDDEVCENEW